MFCAIRCSRSNNLVSRLFREASAFSSSFSNRLSQKTQSRKYRGVTRRGMVTTGIVSGVNVMTSFFAAVFFL